MLTIKFIVVDIKLPFKLGMSFLKSAGITVDYTTKKVIMQSANSKMVKLQGQLNAPEKCLSNSILNALKGFAQAARQDVYACSEK